MAIAIRTGVVEGGTCRVQAGAGIVADSIPEKEYREAENKAARSLPRRGDRARPVFCSRDDAMIFSSTTTTLSPGTSSRRWASWIRTIEVARNDRFDPEEVVARRPSPSSSRPAPGGLSGRDAPSR